MTREEAIQKIQNDLRLHHDDLSGDYRKALRIAIEALQQPEIVRCRECYWWTRQEDSLQGRCALMQSYPTGEWYCGNAREKGEE